MIGQFLERVDLSVPFAISVFGGAILSVFLAQLLWQHGDQNDPPWLRNAHRATLLLKALMFLWALDYGFKQHWQPWPPMVLLVVVIDLHIAARIATVYWRARRQTSAGLNAVRR